jgi:hypothetical protein
MTGSQRAILNFTPGPQGWTWPPGVKFVPLAECSPLCSPPGVNTLYCLEEWRVEPRISPPGDNFSPWGQSSPLEVKLRMALRVTRLDDFRPLGDGLLKAGLYLTHWSLRNKNWGEKNQQRRFKVYVDSSHLLQLYEQVHAHFFKALLSLKSLQCLQSRNLSWTVPANRQTNAR